MNLATSCSSALSIGRGTVPILPTAATRSPITGENAAALDTRTAMPVPSLAWNMRAALRSLRNTRATRADRYAKPKRTISDRRLVLRGATNFAATLWACGANWASLRIVWLTGGAAPYIVPCRRHGRQVAAQSGERDYTGMVRRAKATPTGCCSLRQHGPEH